MVQSGNELSLKTALQSRTLKLIIRAFLDSAEMREVLTNSAKSRLAQLSELVNGIRDQISGIQSSTPNSLTR
jgi:hypothetical protein